MLSIKGDLELMPLQELLQWVEMNGKDGTLSISSCAGVDKFFFFQLGKLIFFDSRKKEEKTGEFLLASGMMNREALTKALDESKKLSIPFLAYLIAEKIFTKEDLHSILDILVRTAITDALQWPSGTFEFKEEVSPLILNGPIKLDITQILFQSFVAHDEEDESGQRHADQALQNLDRTIRSGRINLPPTPELIGKLNNAARDEASSFREISKIIMNDQILTSKILKVVNSPFYGLSGEITSLPHAISIMGLSAVTSIATAHALSAFSPANEKKIKPVLQHSLLSAIIAKQLAKGAGIDPEEAFVCAILHDIGKTILIDFLVPFELPAHHHDNIIRKHHGRAGFMLAREWQLSMIIQEAVLHHHSPDRAKNHPRHVMVTYQANRLANGAVTEEELQEGGMENIRPLLEKINAIKEKITTLL